MGAGVAITCDDVSLTYSAKSGFPIEALRRVSFRINPGRVTALIGRVAAEKHLAADRPWATHTQQR